MELEADMKAQGLSYALITGIVRIRLSGIEKRVLGRWLRVYRQKSRSAYQFVFPSFIQNELVAFTALLGTLWAYMASASAGISAAQLAAFLSCFTFATAALQKMSDSSRILPFLKPTLEIIEPVLQALPEDGGDKNRVQSLSGRILVLDQGRIIEEGNYDELIARQGFFADLVARQQINRKADGQAWTKAANLYRPLPEDVYM